MTSVSMFTEFIIFLKPIEGIQFLFIVVLVSMPNALLNIVGITLTFDNQLLTFPFKAFFF